MKWRHPVPNQNRTVLAPADRALVPINYLLTKHITTIFLGRERILKDILPTHKLKFCPKLYICSNVIVLNNEKHNSLGCDSTGQAGFYCTWLGSDVGVNSHCIDQFVVTRTNPGHNQLTVVLESRTSDHMHVRWGRCWSGTSPAKIINPEREYVYFGFKALEVLVCGWVVLPPLGLRQGIMRQKQKPHISARRKREDRPA